MVLHTIDENRLAAEILQYTRHVGVRPRAHLPIAEKGHAVLRAEHDVEHHAGKGLWHGGERNVIRLARATAPIRAAIHAAQRANHTPAQGNALGSRASNYPKPQRGGTHHPPQPSALPARTHGEAGVGRPFRACPVCPRPTQGVALGWLVSGPLALTPARRRRTTASVARGIAAWAGPTPPRPAPAGPARRSSRRGIGPPMVGSPPPGRVGRSG